MTDKELLELAAKAAGVNGGYSEPLRGIQRDYMDARHGLCHTFWNPLTDDGDALRLAVKLNIAVQHHTEGYVVAWEGRKAGVLEDYEGDPYAATRRAIVRAAAEIGKSKEDKGRPVKPHRSGGGHWVGKP